VGFTATPKVNIDIPAFCQHLVPYHQALPQIQQAIQRAHSAPSLKSHNLCERKQKINYRALHLGQEIQHTKQEIQPKCNKSIQKSVRKSAKATITKLAPGAFSPQQPSAVTASQSLQPSSSSSWNFWPSK
jgi:hypothetical protein